MNDKDKRINDSFYARKKRVVEILKSNTDLNF